MNKNEMPSIHSRRAVLTGLAAAGTGALFWNGRAAAQAANSRRLDVHHHHFSPAWLSALAAQNAVRPVQGYEVMTSYSLTRSLESMDEGGVTTAFLSTTAPGIWFGNPDETRHVAREQNEYGARLVSDYPGRFGLFAVLPLPDVDASLREIEYAADTLEADGFCFVTSFHDVLNGTKWLGDPAFAPVWDELNRRRAVVYTHATVPGCCMGTFEPTVNGTITVEFSTDLARSIISVIESGTANRTPNVTYIWSHGGGTLFAARYLGGDASAASLAGTPAWNSKLHHLRRFYYDTASASDPVHIAQVKMVVGASQIVFGTDFPWGRPSRIAAELERSGLTAEELAGVDRENALKFLPAYA